VCPKVTTPSPARARTVHWSRKAFHGSGVLVVALYAGLPLDRSLAAGLLCGAAVLLLLLDAARSRSAAVQDLFARSFRAILDPKDQGGLNTSTLYFGGCAAAAVLFPRDPACAGILALALGDPLAAVVGGSVQSPRFGRVSLAGSAACLVSATVACRLFAPWPAAVAGGLAATVLEAVAGSKLDNFAIPVGTAAAIHFV